MKSYKIFKVFEAKIGDDYFSVTVTTAADIEIDLTILVLKAGYTNQLITDTGRFWVY